MAALKEAREAAGLTQRDLATRLRRSKSFPYNIEAGERSLNACEFIEYCRAVGLDPAELIRRMERGK